jgi:hypothetical protein
MAVVLMGCGYETPKWLLIEYPDTATAAECGSLACALTRLMSAYVSHIRS